MENNKVIAEFMEYQILRKKYQFLNYNSSNESYYESEEGEIVCDKLGYEVNLYPDSDPLYDLEELPFNSDYNLLMEVINKIVKLGFLYKFTSCYTISGRWIVHKISFQKNTVDHVFNDKYIVKYESDYPNNEDSLTSIYNAVIEFIKWYNEQNKNNEKHTCIIDK